MTAPTWDNPFGIDDSIGQPAIFDQLGIAPPRLNREEAFEAEYLEDQPHGGALLRQQKEDPTPTLGAAMLATQKLAFPSTTGVEPWPAGLVFDISIGVDSTQEILDRYEISPEQYEAFLANPAFRKELSSSIKRNQEEGITFSRRAANIAEDCLPDMYRAIKDPQNPVSARADLWKYMTRVGNLEPKQTKEAAAGNVPMVNIQINL